MATAQNGWPVVPDTDAGRRKLADLDLPGTMPHKVRVLAGDVATIARWHVAEYHRRVEPIKPAGCWGWNVRRIGGPGSDWSNHAAACAWDINAPDNPDGVPTSKVMTKAQIDECHQLERESDNVLRWGGDYQSDPDAMHWEIVGTPAQAAVLAKKIRNEEDNMDQKQFTEYLGVALAAAESQQALKLANHGTVIGRTGVTFGAALGTLLARSGDDLDEAEVARLVLAGLPATELVKAMTDAQAQATADLLAARLAG